MHQHAADALLDTQGLEQRLLLRHVHVQVAGDEVCKATGLGHAVQHLMHDLFRQAALLTQLHGAFARLAMQRLECRILLVDGFHVRRRHHDRREKTFGAGPLECGGAGLAL